MTRFGRVIRGAAVPALLAASATMPASAARAQQAQQAAERPVAFHIAAGPLARAMRQFAEQAAVQLSYPAELARDKRTVGVSGMLSREAALAQMLAGTGLHGQLEGRSLTLLPNTTAQAGDGDHVALATLHVAGASDAAAGKGANGGRRDEADRPFRTAGSSAYVSRAAIDRIPPTAIGDILKTAPGVISSGANIGNTLDINIRGLQGASRVAMLVDGAQSASSDYRGYNGSNNRLSIDPELIGGIEIDKGPTGGPAGAGYTAGVVNISTLRVGDLVPPDERFALRLRGSIGSNTVSPPAVGASGGMFGDKDKRFHPRFRDGDWPALRNHFGSIALGARFARVDLVAALSQRDQGNYFSGRQGGNPVGEYERGEEVLNTSQHTTSGLLKATLHLAPDHALELGYIRYDSRYGESWESELVWLSGKNQKPEQFAKTDTYTAKYTFRPAGQSLIDLTLQGAVVDKTESSIASDAPFHTRNTGASLVNRSVAELPGDAVLTSSNGVSLSWEKGRDDASEKAMLANANGERQITSLFSDNSIGVADWLTLTGSARYIYYHLRRDLADDDPRGSAEMRAIPKTGSGSGTTVAGSITLSPFHGIGIYAQYTEGYRPVSLREWTMGMAWTYLVPNPNLRPERARNVEIGVNVLRDGLLFAGDRLRLKVSRFDNHNIDYVIRTQCTTHVCTDGGYRWWRTPYNIDHADFRGYEISGSYDIGRLFAEGAYTRYDHVEYCMTADKCDEKPFVSDYQRVYVPPRYTGSGTLGLRLFDRALTLGGRITVFGARVSDQAARTFDGEAIWGAFAQFQPWAATRLDLSAENIGDHFYYDVMSTARIPASGRTVRLTLTQRL